MPFSRERLLLFLLPAALLAVSSTPPHGRSMGIAPPFLAAPTPWADSVFSTLSLDDRIGQLMMVAAYSNKDAKHEAEIEALVRERNIGGLIFFQGGPLRQAHLTNRYHGAARTRPDDGYEARRATDGGTRWRLDHQHRLYRGVRSGLLIETHD